MGKIKTWWKHFLMFWIGSREMDLKGSTMLPCKSCHKEFKSYPHYRDWYEVYDVLCPKCDKIINKDFYEERVYENINDDSRVSAKTN